MRECWLNNRQCLKLCIMKMNRRLIHVWAGISLQEGDIGEGRVRIKLTNHRDAMLAREGLLKPEQIRSLEIDALVDTGAIRSVIPARIQQQLGVATAFQTRAQYADGRTEEVPVTQPIRVEIQGRPLYEECLVLGDE